MDLISEFSLAGNISYLDHAAVSPWPRRSIQAITAFAEENATVGSKHYLRWLQVEAALREQLRLLVNAPSADDIALLKNTSEALSVIAYGLEWQSGENIVSYAEEFPSNRIVWQSLAKFGVELRLAQFDGDLSPEDAILALVDEHTKLITISSVQFASGLRMDLNRLGKFCHANNILLCVDAIQSLGAFQFDAMACHADFVVADGHKWMLGPEGLALFYCKPELRDQLSLQQYGWHMVENRGDFSSHEWRIARTATRFECGSPNMLGIHAMAASLSLLHEFGMENVENNILANTQYMFDRITANPDLELLSDTTTARRSGIVILKHRHIDSKDLYQTLTKNNIMCALRGGGVRFSPHFYTPRPAIARAFEMIANISR